MREDILENLQHEIYDRCQKQTNKFGIGIYYHIVEVVNNAEILAEKYGADKEIVMIAAWLHDIASITDYNLYELHHIHGAEMAHLILKEYDYDDKIHGDENVDYTYKPPNGNNSSDSSYTGSSVNGDTSISDLANALTNGFGLAGENGMIDMFSDMFGFIPAPVWTLILTGISVLIAIALLKAVL